MKRMQCTKCKQVFWADLKIDEALIRSGEWIQTSCPKCRAEWAIVEPGRSRPGWPRKRTVKPPTRRQQAGPPPEGTISPFSPARIRSLRKRLGLSQKIFASLVGVNRETIVGWEAGKFRPKEERMEGLSTLAMKAKEEVKRLLGEKMAEQEAKPNPNRSKRRRGASQKGAKDPRK